MTLLLSSATFAQTPGTPPGDAEAAQIVKQHAPAKLPRKGQIAKGFMLTITDPGCDPGENCDDVGPYSSIRRAYKDVAGVNQGEFGINWGDTEPAAPVDGKHTYDFSRVNPTAWTLKHKYLICHLGHFGSWADSLQKTDRAQYNRNLEAWAEAACKYAREKFGVTLFMAGGNERDLLAESSFTPHFKNWYEYYMDPVIAIHKGMKKAGADNKLIIGNFCYTDRAHVACIYLAGGKGHFEILAVHPYGPRGMNIDLEQIIEARQELDYRGDSHIPILITEGWSSLPLPESLEKDKPWRGGSRPYTPAEVEHYRQSVLDGWRNITTPKPGYYDPKWVTGATYFVLNDHWGGRGWAARGTPQYDASGKLEGFLLDGYFIGTNDPDYLKPLLRPWGLIDIEGRPKGDTIYGFPPYIPKHSFSGKLSEKLPLSWYDPRNKHWTAPQVSVGKTYRATVSFTNKEKTAMTGCRWSLAEKSDKDFPGGYAFAFVQGQLQTKAAPADEHYVKARLIGAAPKSVQPGETVTLTYEVRFDNELARQDDGGNRKRVRPICDLFYIWEGRPYHTDAYLPRVTVVTQ